MRRRSVQALILAAAVLAAVLVGGGPTGAAPPCTISWVGGATGLWQTPSNWDLNRVPAPGDVVCVPAGVTVTHSSGTTTIQTLLSQGAVSLTAGSLDMTGAGADESSVATFQLSGGGVLGGAGTLVVTGTLTWTAGTMTDAGTTRIEAGATLAHNGTVALSSGRVLLNAGRIEMQGAGTTWIDSIGVPEPLLHNTGTIEKTSLAAATPTIYADLDNDGAVRSPAGPLNLRSGGGISGGTFGAPGVTGEVDFEAGAFELGDGAGLLGGVRISGATLNVAAAATAVASGTNTLANGNIGGTGILNVTGALAWTGGTMRDGGTTLIGPAALLAHNGTVALHNGRVLLNQGRLEMQGAGWIDGTGAPASLLHNVGTIEKTSAAGLLPTIYAPLDNDGAVRSLAGTLNLRQGGGSSAGEFGAASATGEVDFESGTFEFGNGARLLGGVRLSGSTVNVAPGATAIASGANSFALGNLGGTGTLEVTGTLAWLGGTMRDGGITRVTAAGAIHHNGFVTLRDGRLLQNAGRLELQGAGWIDGTGAPTPLLHNTGTIEKTSPAASTPIIYAALDNDGAVLSPAGILELRAGGGTAAGAFGSPGSAGTVRLESGTFLLAEGASFLGGVDMAGATVDVTPAATATASGSNSMSAGNLGGAGTFRVTGTLAWTGGAMRENGTTFVPPGGVINQQGFTTLRDTRVLENAGRLHLHLNNFLSQIGTPLLHNTGEIEKTGVGTFGLQVALDNDGTVVAQAGVLNLSGGDGPAAQSGSFRAEAPAQVSFLFGNYDFGHGTQLAGGVRIAGARVIVPEGATATATGATANELVSGFIDGPGTFLVDGPFVWRGGTMEGAGRTVVAAGRELRLTACCQTLTGNRRLVNGGTLVVDGGRISVIQGAVIENLNRIEMLGAGSFEGFTGNSPLENPGTIVKTAGAVETSRLELPLVNTGEVRAEVGTILIGWGDGPAEQGGEFHGTGLGEVVFDWGEWDLGPGSRFTGGVTIEGATISVPAGYTLPVSGTAGLVGGGALAGLGTVEISGTFTWSDGVMSDAGLTLIATGGVLVVDALEGFTIGLFDGRTVLNRGTVDWPAGSMAVFDAIVLNEGTIDLRGNDALGFVGSDGTLLHNTGLIRKSAGTGVSELNMLVDNEGTIEAAAGTLAIQGTLVNASQVTDSLTGGAFIARDATLELPGFPLAVNASTIVLDGAASQLTARVGDDSFDALADLRRNAGAGELRLENGKMLMVSGEFRNLGLVHVGAGAQLTSGGRYVQAGGRTELANGTLRATSADVELTGGRLGGAGTIGSHLMASGGELSPGLSSTSDLFVDSLWMGAGAALAVQIEGTQASDAFDRLNVDHNAQLGGTLRITTATGFTPIAGETYPILLSSSSRTGTFAAEEGLEIGGVPTYVVEYGPVGVALHVLGSPAPIPPVEPKPSPPPVDPGLRVIDNGALSVLRGRWKTYRGAGFYGGTFTASSRRGSALIRPGVVTRRLGVLVGRCRRCGILEIFWNGRLLRRVDLSSRTARPSRLVRMPVFRAQRTGTVTLKVASAGRPVRIDGLVEIAG